MAKTDKIDERILNRIRKLVNLAEGTTFDGELEAAMLQARQLLDKYNLEWEDVLNSKSPEANQTLEVVEEGVNKRVGKVERYDSRLAVIIAEFCDCRVYLKHTNDISSRTGKWRTIEHIIIFGLRRDVAIAKVLFKELFMTMRLMSRLHYGPKYGSEHRNYSEGFVAGLASKANRSKETSQAEAGTCAIVLQKGAIVNAHAAKLGLEKTKARRSRSHDWNAFGRGASDGRKQNLNRSDKISGTNRGRTLPGS